MKFEDFIRSGGPSFVALQYHSMILNRTYLGLITNKYLICLQANGLLTSQTYASPAEKAETRSLNDPKFYLSDKYLSRYTGLDIEGDKILRVFRPNFRIPKADLLDVTYSAQSKWGMGEYPHDGMVYVKTRRLRVEFIITGNQSGSAIAKLIRS